MEHSATKKNIYNFLEIVLNTNPNVKVVKKINGDLIVKYNCKYLVIESFTDEALGELKSFIKGN